MSASCVALVSQPPVQGKQQEVPLTRLGWPSWKRWILWGSALLRFPTPHRVRPASGVCVLCSLPLPWTLAPMPRETNYGWVLW